MARDFKDTEVRIQNCRLSYANIWNPRIEEDGSKGKYSVSLIIDKKDEVTLKRIKLAIEAAKKQGKSKLANAQGYIPKDLKTPLRDADEEGRIDEAYVGMMFLNATSKSKPKIVDRHLERITDEDEVYSGCYANVIVNFYAYKVNGNKGIAAGLGNIQKVKDGERLGGGSNPEADFDELEDEEYEDAMLA
ncbi:MAG: DUF2815 family protein [Selenomonadaceae bacterium]|nr:DUF2815 family protein [Selenomonadaceae bacterium]